MHEASAIRFRKRKGSTVHLKRKCIKALRKNMEGSRRMRSIVEAEGGGDSASAEKTTGKHGRVTNEQLINPSTWEAEAGGFLSSRPAWSTK